MNQPKKIVNPYNKYIFSTKLSLVLSVFSLLTLVFALSLIWYNVKHIEKIKSNFTQNTTGIHQTLTSTQQSLNNLTQQLQQQSELETKLSKMVDHPQKNTQIQLIHRALSLLQLAQLQLTTQVNTATSILLLNQANHTLSLLSNALSAPYNKKITAIINEIKDAKNLDIGAQIQQLSALREAILQLTFIPTTQVSTTTTEPATSADSSSKWATLSKDMTHYLDRLITVRYHEIPQSPLADTHHENDFKQYLLLKTSEAEWALLNNNNELYQLSLKDISQQIKTTVGDTSKQQTMLAQISALQKIQFGYNRTKLIDQIDDMIADLSHVQTSAAPHAKKPSLTPSTTKNPSPVPSTNAGSSAKPNVSVEI